MYVESPTSPDQEKIPLLDRDGAPVMGVGRLDQVIGAEEADRFFTEREVRRRALMSRAIKRWATGGTGYSVRRRA